MKYLLLFFACAIALHAQGVPSFYVDIASFQYDEQVNYVEVYYAFPRSALSYTKTNGTFSGSLLLNLVARTDETSDPVVRVWRVPVQTADTAGLSDNMLIGVSNLSLPPARYSFSIVARDERTSKVVDSLTVPFEIRKFSSRTAFSDIQMCSSIRKIDEDRMNVFYKNTLEVIPNPPLIYGKSIPAVLYYAELYSPTLETYLIKTEIVSSYGKTVSLRSTRKSGKFPSRVEVGTIPIGHLASGSYTFIISFADTLGSVRTSQTKTFYVFNPDVPLDTVQAITTAAKVALEFSAMPEDGLDAHFSMCNFIATQEEKSTYRALKGPEAKRKFLTRFWDGRDTDPATPQNEGYSNYMSLITVANERYRTAYKDGWRTDRGRVLILYGRPDYIERKTGESDTKPTEIWTYDNLQGGVEFIFVDKGGFNEFELVHSTMRNEINNPNWEQQMQTR